MTTFLANRLDLSRLRRLSPSLIRALDYEAILDERRAMLVAKFAAGGVDYDVGALETDSAMIVEQVDAYRELLDRQAVNDGFRACLPAFAKGADLDHLVLRAGLLRLDGEADDDLLMRYFASFSAPSAGSADAYVFQSKTAFSSAVDIAVLGPETHGQPGLVDVVVVPPAGGVVSDAGLAAIRAACNGKRSRPLTDVVSVQSAVIVPYSVAITAVLPAGPDPSMARTEILAGLAEITSARYHAGGRVPVAALAAPAYDAGAAIVAVASPAADIAPDPYAAPWCVGVAVTIRQEV